MTVLALTALLAAGCAPGAAQVRHRVPGTGAATAGVPSATPVASHGATSAVGSHPAPARPRQLITVTAASYHATYATLAAYRRTSHGWQRVFGPWVVRR